jgi:UDP-N-acetylglucosamine 4,6-dehydratase
MWRKVAAVKVVITGSEGSVGKALTPVLQARGDEVHGLDIVTGLDILDELALRSALQLAEPDVIFHCAGAKHAPEGEVEPWDATRVNVEGTRNVLQAAPDGCRMVLTSTCKACNPETVYGATKLIAERLTLNAGQTVARFYNVREASGNVFEIWAGMQPPLPATSCYRYFITMPQAVGLLLRVVQMPPGRYTLDPGYSVLMLVEAAALVGRENVEIMRPRRGDRLKEPRIGGGESLVPLGNGVERIHSRHD